MDLSVAALIGLSSVAAIAALNPNQFSAENRVYSEQASLEEYLLLVTSKLGLPWMQRASPRALCSALVSFSNSSLTLSAEDGGFVCESGPPLGATSASITLQFENENLTLWAWFTGGR